MTLNGLLNTGLLGVYTNKVAMSVVAHNISNSNTQGFSRQSPVIVTTNPINLTTIGSGGAALSFGTGSTVSDIQRVRDEFLDLQFRETSSHLNYWENIYSNVHYIEQLFGEPGETGLRNMYDSYWASIEELKTDPSNEAAKTQVVSRAEELVNTMKDLNYRLEELKSDINSEIKLRIDEINGYLKRIADLNQKILTSSSISGSPNDLLDERDRLLDKLSELSDIRITSHSNGQISLSMGDKVVLNGSSYQEITSLTIAETNDEYYAYVGNNPLTFNDGKMSALFELRDEIIPSYQQQLDEFGLYLVDSTNLIYKEGWDSTGTITGANFFADISTKRGFEDSRFFRIAGNSDVFHPDTLKYTTSHRSFYENPLDPSSDYYLIDKFNKSYIYAVDANNEKPHQYIYDPKDPDPDNKPIKYDAANNAIYFYDTYYDEDSNFQNKLVVDIKGDFLREYGFPTKEIKAYKIDPDNVQPGNLEFEILGEDCNISFSDAGELVSNINSGSGGYLKAEEIDGFIYILPTTKIPDADLDTIVLNDVDGSLSQMEAQKVTLDALDTSQPTLNNLLSSNEIIEMSINGIKIEINPLKDTVYDLADKINATNTGVTASVTPHGSFVLRAGNLINFDLKNVTIKGPEKLFNALGFIEDDSNNIVTLISPDISPEQIDEKFSKAELLRIDKELGIVNQISVSSNLKENPSLLATDLGYYDTNYSPTGAGNISVWDEISKMYDNSVLDNGRIGFSNFLGNIVTDIGVKGETADKMRLNSEMLNSEISLEKERVMGVSIDEEMTNLVKYQQAFNASARVITAVNQMMETVINNLGVV
ncbi:flagellar hook protein FlgK [Petrotoga mexicana DSM 14811]|uniref:Flagellar hook-associated protein 1 n=1 Tax=Petrotoga mexicana DSM 14811 TaxID=1122954 RepID=A0A2K1PEI2_9BACT|nr:flagellar hook-associated protein FlgK [Petrotoga mexicana]PNS01199.1 flagellar hook protein FlgK [Petrotoga mexicana DSM 14811]